MKKTIIRTLTYVYSDEETMEEDMKHWHVPPQTEHAVNFGYKKFVMSKIEGPFDVKES